MFVCIILYTTHINQAHILYIALLLNLRMSARSLPHFLYDFNCACATLRRNAAVKSHTRGVNIHAEINTPHQAPKALNYRCSAKACGCLTDICVVFFFHYLLRMDLRCQKAIKQIKYLTGWQ